MGSASFTSVASCAGILGLLYILNFLYKRSKRVPLDGKVVLITGASSGLGEACAHAFHAAGCKVILAARREDQLLRVKAALLEHAKPNSVEPVVLPLDLSDFDVLALKVEQAVTHHGHIDILINNGGISFRGEIDDTNLTVDQHVMAVNYFGQVALTKAVLPYMVRRRQGHIVTVSSLQGKMSIPFRSAYSASKHALQAFMDCLRAEVARSGIHVALVSPGYVRTNLSRNAVTADGRTHGVMDATTASGMSPSYVAQQIVGVVQERKADVILASPLHTTAVYLRTLAPTLYFWIMRRRAKKQRIELTKNE